jgi:hypothetical protein
LEKQHDSLYRKRKMTTKQKQSQKSKVVNNYKTMGNNILKFIYSIESLQS